ncbi:MAG: integrase arm-type DNA-binding domain-containing protein [Betaproteobacteria bacterium]|nr:integrase arm-type DNA-binding domain-containing protein [Betaproteobacteria bacterium]
MATGSLTVKEVEAKRRTVGMHRIAPGLYLRVASGATAYWMLRYSRTVEGKVKTTEMSLGRYESMTLAQATAKAAAHRVARKVEGIDPLEAKHKKDEREAGGNTFKGVALALIEAKRAGWKNAKHASQWENTLATYAYPLIGERDVADIDTAAVLEVLTPIWTTKHETATRLRQRIEMVLSAAKVRGLRSGENPAAWKGHLDNLLAAIPKKARTRHHPAMQWADLPAFMVELRARPSASAHALEFAILTACRTGEVIGARWPEIDLDGATWTIPKERMKAKVEHRVALSPRAVELLRSLPRRDDTDIVFYTVKADKPRALSNMAMLELLRGMRPGLTVHGFRSTFRDWAGETTHHPREIIEHAMAHQLADQAEAAYARGTLLERRRVLMRDWADFCASKPKIAALPSAA